MKKVLLLITIVTLTIVTAVNLPARDTDASSLCPSNMDPSSRECLDYLRAKLAEANKQQSALSKKLADEQYQQLSLQEKINYITQQVAETERVINTLHMEIAAQDVEINLLAKEIQAKEDQLSILKQEINILKEVVNQRVTESYKYSYVGFLELIMDVKNIDTVLRKTKYLIETREKDKSSLESYGKRTEELEQEEILLAKERAELQIKRNDIEVEKTRLVEEKNSLAAQKAERERLLAESQRRGREILAQLDTYRTMQSSFDNAIMEYIAAHGDKMANYGWVTKGTWIGTVKEGSSACSTGTHLHFSIDTIGSSAWDGCGKVNTFAGHLVKSTDYWWMSASGWKYFYITSGSMRVPLGGTVILTGDGSTHSARGSCTAPRYAIDITSTLWTNIPVYAAMDGNLRKGVDSCGDQYAVIDNPNTGLRTAYFHMKR
ncbi:hypothetical protein CVU76_01795 [Candidatus Dojkabacteria bacterium HGW-Dojkabacteria-1]|uniref:Peptidase M23 domain-containing protein n=1 Tax=Candidatus Dojkabacteria bacterium HGW-Dojkabacteria-1 TaxID=2013761 RepID=A0A2N2F3J8_9BACT|nr:MAG: hypothetical protein CVU76_01795 [Candidatus Dojkabacteria bacterium HGW-Dojkabacteria-1]